MNEPPSGHTQCNGPKQNPPYGAPGQYPPKEPGKYTPPVAPGQHPPPYVPGQYPSSGSPGQYSSSGAPAQYPSPGTHGQYPSHGSPEQYLPPAVPGQHPPPGFPGQFSPPGAPGQYPPPGAPGQYPPPGAPGQYPPPGAPGQYPPPGAPGQFSPPGAPGQYPPPGAPGQYPPGAPGQYPSPEAPGKYPPSGEPGKYPTPGAPGQYPPPGAPAQYPTAGAHGHYTPVHTGQYPPHRSHSHTLPTVPGDIGTQGEDAVDSDGADYLRTRHDKHPINVKFVNRTNEKVIIFWIDQRGKFQKLTKLRHGQSKDVDTFESHPFVAEAKKGPQVVINGNVAFLADHVPGGNGSVTADISYGPTRKNLRSSHSGAPVTLKFSNRTHKKVSLKLIDPDGCSKYIKDLDPKKAWVYNARDGQYFTAVEIDKEELELNYGWFYLSRPGKDGSVKKVLITEPMDQISSSSSSD